MLRRKTPIRAKSETFPFSAACIIIISGMPLRFSITLLVPSPGLFTGHLSFHQEKSASLIHISTHFFMVMVLGLSLFRFCVLFPSPNAQAVSLSRLPSSPFFICCHFGSVSPYSTQMSRDFLPQDFQPRPFSFVVTSGSVHKHRLR